MEDKGMSRQQACSGGKQRTPAGVLVVSYLPIRIKMPATMAKTGRPLVTISSIVPVRVTKSIPSTPVRMSQIPKRMEPTRFTVFSSFVLA
jgi:hypothetical protein